MAIREGVRLMLWDVFISHAGEDKSDVARPLAQALEKAGLRVWLDEAQVELGDSLRAKIDDGLMQSRFGVVVLSPSFFAKDWPQRELNSLLAKESGGQKAILPVWHHIGPTDIAQFSPLLADRIAVSTEFGLEEVANKILYVAGQHLDRTARSVVGRYSSDFDYPLDRLTHAVDVIHSLGQPQTWQHLKITRPGYPEHGWMGCDSSALVDILYDLMSPLVEFRQMDYGLRRSLSVFRRRARALFGLLEAAFEALFNDYNIANSACPIAYTPRVPDWRVKRPRNPQRYWWQGISRERFDKAVPYFICTDSEQLVTIQEFRGTYHRLYNSTDARGQQDLGLLANALYGFTPESRPVYWRLLIYWLRLYHAALCNGQLEPDEPDLDLIERLLSPSESCNILHGFPMEDLQLFEPLDVSIQATSEHLVTFAIPRLRSYLEAPREE
jgi:hypothetical protein